jgi:hypothetical protein
MYVYMVVSTGALLKDWRQLMNDEGPPSSSPLDDMEFWAADRRYRFTTAAVDPGDRRPEYILIPDLPGRLAKDGVSPADNAGLAFFKYDHCGGPCTRRDRGDRTAGRAVTSSRPARPQVFLCFFFDVGLVGA